MEDTSSYVLVTAAYNEGRLIEQTISSIVSQSVRPKKWVIVSDGSSDNTDEIVERYAKRYEFLYFHRVCEDHPRNFAAQVNAINLGLSLLEGTEYSFVGNIDADITLDPNYFKRLLNEFRKDDRLGIGGGAICERARNGVFKDRPGNSIGSVAHACQLFRRKCFDAIGGAYLPLPYGGPDTYAEILARKSCWRVASFTHLKVFHHRRTASAGGVLRGCFRQGKMDYSLGTLPLFEAFKLLRRILVKPYLVGAIARCAGFLHSYWRREKRDIPQDVLLYFRNEQRRRLAQLVSIFDQQQSRVGLE
jgi:poly-beta-1,6-N-acetyl-D-glucosamine synthase